MSAVAIACRCQEIHSQINHFLKFHPVTAAGFHVAFTRGPGSPLSSFIAKLASLFVQQKIQRPGDLTAVVNVLRREKQKLQSQELLWISKLSRLCFQPCLAVTSPMETSRGILEKSKVGQAELGLQQDQQDLCAGRQEQGQTPAGTAACSQP